MMNGEDLNKAKRGKPTLNVDKPDDRQLLYMNSNYNIKFCHGNDADVVIGRIINGLVSKLNQEHKLLKYLLVVVDADIIDDLNIFEYGAHCGLAQNVNWMVNQIDSIL